jgi:hypothetical protein
LLECPLPTFPNRHFRHFADVHIYQKPTFNQVTSESAYERRH